MGLLDIFKKKTYYFDKNIPPQCGYCQYGRRTKDGNMILCEKQGLTEETHSCNKFLYSPIKRIPTKQLKIEGALTEEELYLELPEEVIEELALPEMPDDMKAPEVPDALKAPEVPDALKTTEVIDILNEIENPEQIPPSAEITAPESVPDIPDVPDIPEAVPVPEIPDSPEENN